MTLDEFLQLPETEPASEFICGEVVQKTMPSFEHSRIAFILAFLFETYFRKAGQGVGVIELRHSDRDESRAYLPDVGILLSGRVPRDARTRKRGPIESPPDIAIEILSPDDRPSRVSEKLTFYMRAGVPLVWIIDPETRELHAHRPGSPSTVHRSPEVIGAQPVLSNFELSLDELFAVLDEPTVGDA
jgi:Uma2 family endonuclease